MSLKKVREHLFASEMILDTSGIKVIREAVKSHTDKLIRNLEDELNPLDYTENSLCDQIDFEEYQSLLSKYKAIRVTVNELCISFLYVETESLLKDHVLKKIPNALEGKRSSMEKLLRNLPFDLEHVSGHKYFTELRLINNCIKHDNGIVSKRLAKVLPNYKVGQKLTKLEEKYNQLEPKVRHFASQFLVTLNNLK